MRKYLTLIVAIVCLFFLTLSVFAATDLFSVGKSSDSNLVKITSTGIVEGPRASYEVFTTGDTLTAIESGKTFILNRSAGHGVALTAAGTTYVFRLPADALGLEYNFVAAGNGFFHVKPALGDTIIHLALDANDKLAPAGSTSDSLTLICGAANTWYVKSMRGTWSDQGN